MSQTLDKQTRGLLAEYYLRALQPDELARLQEILANDADARRVFVEMGRDEWLLHHVHHTEMNQMIHFPKRARNRARVRLVAAAAAVVAVVGALLYSRSATISEAIAARTHAPSIARVSECYVLEDEAISVVNAGRVRELKDGSPIREGDRVVVPPGCRLTLQYLDEETYVTLDGGSLARLETQQGKRVRLLRGRLQAEVDKQEVDQPMRVATGDSEVLVVGTAFEVFAGAVTRLSVSSGTVRFRSLNSDREVLVKAGFFANSAEGQMLSQPFKMVRLLPDAVSTTSYSAEAQFMVVDPKRDRRGRMAFNLSDLDGKIVEASLRLRVMGHQKDFGGSGELRLFMTDAKATHEVGHYSGGVGKGQDLVMDLDATALKEGANVFILALDEGGNDFWFSSNQGPAAPMLELRVVDE